MPDGRHPSRRSDREVATQLTPREFDKLIIHMMAEVALKRKAGGIKLNYPEAVAIVSARALEGARAGKSIEEVTKDARTALTKDDVMDGVADLIPMVQVEAVFTDGSRLVTVTPPFNKNVPASSATRRSQPWQV
jgi:urease subunit gamma